MTGSDRRQDNRVPVEMFMNQYVKDEPYRGLAMNVSETGLYVQRLAEPTSRHARIIALEFELPGTGELIWAKAETRYEAIDYYFHFVGLRFLGMAGKHERLVRDFVYDKQHRLADSVLHRFKRQQLLCAA